MVCPATGRTGQRALARARVVTSRLPGSALTSSLAGWMSALYLLQESHRQAVMTLAFRVLHRVLHQNSGLCAPECRECQDRTGAGAVVFGNAAARS